MTTHASHDPASPATPVRDLRAVLVVASLLCLAAAITLIITVYNPNPANRSIPVRVAILALMAASVGFFVLLLHNLRRLRTEMLSKAALAQGLRPTPLLSAESKRQVFGPFAGLPLLRSGSKGVHFHAAGESRGVPVEVIEHVYVVSTGKSAHTVTHSVFTTPCPSSWPPLSLTPSGPLSKMWEAITGPDLQVEDESFNRRWKIKCESQDFALLFLSPEAQRFLAAGPAHETWHVAGGSLCWVARRKLAHQEIAATVERLARLRAMLPPELEFFNA
jgi:hypothetical protein